METTMKFTASDKRHIRATIRAMADEYAPEPEIIMTSQGYVEVWPDGDVVAHGVVVYSER